LGAVIRELNRAIMEFPEKKIASCPELNYSNVILCSRHLVIMGFSGKIINARKIK
jgi:hypothetical protein